MRFLDRLPDRLRRGGHGDVFGADGVVSKDAEPSVFLDSLREAARGEVVLQDVSLGGVRTVVADLDRHVEGATSALTDRQVQVLALAAEGLTARQIGSRLRLRERTVTTHLSRIYSRLGVSSRVAAVTAATRDGLVRLGASG